MQSSLPALTLVSHLCACYPYTRYGGTVEFVCGHLCIKLSSWHYHLYCSSAEIVGVCFKCFQSETIDYNVHEFLGCQSKCFHFNAYYYHYWFAKWDWYNFFFVPYTPFCVSQKTKQLYITTLVVIIKYIFGFSNYNFSTEYRPGSSLTDLVAVLLKVKINNCN